MNGAQSAIFFPTVGLSTSGSKGIISALFVPGHP